MLEKITDSYIPYRKSYKSPNNKEITGWRTPTIPSGPSTNSLDVHSPYRVHSHREFNLSPRYPKIDKTPTMLLPTINKSNSHSYLATPNSSTRQPLYPSPRLETFTYDAYFNSEEPHRPTHFSKSPSASSGIFGKETARISQGSFDNQYCSGPQKINNYETQTNLLDPEYNIKEEKYINKRNPTIFGNKNPKMFVNNPVENLVYPFNKALYTNKAVVQVKVKTEKQEKKRNGGLLLSDREINKIYTPRKSTEGEVIEESKQPADNTSRSSYRSSISSISAPKIFIQGEIGDIEATSIDQSDYNSNEKSCTKENLSESSLQSSSNPSLLQISNKSINPLKTYSKNNNNILNRIHPVNAEKGERNISDRLQTYRTQNYNISSDGFLMEPIKRNSLKVTFSHSDSKFSISGGVKSPTDNSTSKYSISSGVKSPVNQSKVLVSKGNYKEGKKNKGFSSNKADFNEGSNAEKTEEEGNTNVYQKKIGEKSFNKKKQISNIYSVENHTTADPEIAQPKAKKLSKKNRTAKSTENLKHKNNSDQKKTKRRKLLRNSERKPETEPLPKKNYRISINSAVGIDEDHFQKNFPERSSVKLLKAKVKRRRIRNSTTGNKDSPEASDSLRSIIDAISSSEYSSSYTSMPNSESSLFSNKAPSKTIDSVQKSSSVDRFINNFSLSILTTLTFLVFDLQEGLSEITSNNKTIDLQKINLLHLSKDDTGNLKEKIKKKLLGKRMKVELNIMFKQVFRKQSQKVNTKSINLLIRKIRSSLISEGIKSSLIEYLNSEEMLTGKSDIMKAMGNIIKKRLKNNRNFSADFSISESRSDGTTSSHSANSSSEEDSLRAYKNKYNKRNLDRFRYEITHLKTIRFKGNELNREATINEPQYFDGKNFTAAEDAKFEENDEDVSKEIESMNCCNSEKALKYLFTSPVLYKNITENMIDKYRPENGLDLEGNDIDLKNFEAMILKKRFLDLNKMNSGAYDEQFKVVVEKNDNLDPSELDNIERNKVKKYIKRNRYFKKNDRVEIIPKKKLSFTNIILPSSLTGRSLKKSSSDLFKYQNTFLLITK